MPGTLENERRVAAAIQTALHLGLAVALLWLLAVYLRDVQPNAVREAPRWLEIGFPIAICLGAVHFLRRSWLAFRRFRES
jgi:uncharacterized membrane protein YhdT